MHCVTYLHVTLTQCGNRHHQVHHTLSFSCVVWSTLQNSTQSRTNKLHNKHRIFSCSPIIISYNSASTYMYISKSKSSQIKNEIILIHYLTFQRRRTHQLILHPNQTLKRPWVFKAYDSTTSLKRLLSYKIISVPQQALQRYGWSKAQIITLLLLIWHIDQHYWISLFDLSIIVCMCGFLLQHPCISLIFCGNSWLLLMLAWSSNGYDLWLHISIQIYLFILE